MKTRHMNIFNEVGHEEKCGIAAFSVILFIEDIDYGKKNIQIRSHNRYV